MFAPMNQRGRDGLIEDDCSVLSSASGRMGREATRAVTRTATNTAAADPQQQYIEEPTQEDSRLYSRRDPGACGLDEPASPDAGLETLLGGPFRPGAAWPFPVENRPLEIDPHLLDLHAFSEKNQRRIAEAEIRALGGVLDEAEAPEEGAQARRIRFPARVFSARVARSFQSPPAPVAARLSLGSRRAGPRGTSGTPAPVAAAGGSAPPRQERPGCPEAPGAAGEAGEPWGGRSPGCRAPRP